MPRRSSTLFIALWLTACGDGGTEAGWKCLAPVIEDGSAAHAVCIADEETWLSLMARPPEQTVARTEVVKFLIDVEDGRRPYFVNTGRWSIHYEFARTHLDRPGLSVASHAVFNEREYQSEHRRFEMGSLVRYLDTGHWTMELLPGDTLSGPRVLRAFEQLKRAVFFGDALRYRPISLLHERQIEEVRDALPIVDADEVFRGARYQPLTRGVAIGELRFVRASDDLRDTRADQILVLEEIPDEVPMSAGVISAQLQAPLGHVAILCATRRTPNMALRDAMTNEMLRRLEGRRVRLEVGPQDFTIAEARPGAASAPRSRPLGRPALAVDGGALRELCALSLDDAGTVGAKAAQLGEACSLGAPIVTPGGFVIPFSHYASHESRASLPELAPSLDRAQRDVELADRRGRIEAVPLDEQLLRQVMARVHRFEGEPRVILRSSTNAEDLEGFTGAGLYRSVVVAQSAGADEIADAVRQVWASVWRHAAFEERELFGIPHDDVRMAVLVQPFVADARVNAVAVTANPFYSRRPGYLVNAQPMTASVTGARGGEIPEQHLIYTFMEGHVAEILSRSSEHDGFLLDSDDLAAIASVLERLHVHFMPRWRGHANAVDVELLLTGADRRVVVLQARPYYVDPVD